MQDDLDTRFGNINRKKAKAAKGKKDAKDESSKPKKKLTFVPYSRYKNGAHHALQISSESPVLIHSVELCELSSHAWAVHQPASPVVPLNSGYFRCLEECLAWASRCWSVSACASCTTNTHRAVLQ